MNGKDTIKVKGYRYNINFKKLKKWIKTIKSCLRGVMHKQAIR